MHRRGLLVSGRGAFPVARVQAELRQGLAGLDPALNTAELATALTEFLRELQRWNRAYNLTAVRDPLAMVARHVLDACTVNPWVAGPRVLDVGTGAGVPGLPLALLHPELRFTLLDSNGKKTRFVTHAAAHLRLGNVDVVQARVEDFAAEPFATVVCRAFTTLADFVGGAAHLLAAGGALVAMKGRYPEAELNAVPAGWRVAECAPVQVPGLESERHIVVLRRAG